MRIDPACTEDRTQCRQICYFLDVSEKGFITYSFSKWPLYTLETAERKYTYAISKHMKTGKTQCWALFVISEATFTKTAIKAKFVDRFF